MGNNDNGGSFALGLLVGGIIGALIGMLLAPKPGAETRSEIWERSELLRSRADEAAASLRERVGPAAEGVGSRFAPAVDSVRERGASAMGSVNARLGRGQVHDRSGDLRGRGLPGGQHPGRRQDRLAPGAAGHMRSHATRCPLVYVRIRSQ